jgi:MarR family transcriptional regulator, organic hydroperoxide resistance regulator
MILSRQPGVRRQLIVTGAQHRVNRKLVNSISSIYLLLCNCMPDDLVERGLDLYRTAAHALHELGAPAWHQVEISVAQLKALFVLVDGGPTPIGGVAARLSIGLPAASSLVDRLVDHGLAQRQEDRLDRRRTLAEPTEAGEALAQRLRQGSREALRSWLERMDRDDLEALVRGLAAMSAVSRSPGRPLPGTGARRTRVAVEE